MDFTIKRYEKLLNTLQTQGFSFLPLACCIKQEADYDRMVILRHDVETRYPNSLLFAEMQNKIGIKGSYYFRILNFREDVMIIAKIAGLGHEIGYHYDDLSFCKGDHQAAIQRFEKHLNLLREIAPVQTITMEGAPLSKYDNKDLWKNYNYRDYGIIAEPYFDLNFGTEFSQTKNHKTKNEKVGSLASPQAGWQGAVGKNQEHEARLPCEALAKQGNTKTETRLPCEALAKQGNTQPATSNLSVAKSRTELAKSGQQPATRDNFFYLTDTGRRWDGWRVSLRDKVPQQEEWIKQGLVFRSTHDIIQAANEGRLPDKIMMTFHPQRWNDAFLPWMTELVSQKVKNQVKRVLVSVREP